MESILLEDNPHRTNFRAYDHFIEQEMLANASTLMTKKEILAIIGARRVGKSTLSNLLIKELLGRVSRQKLFFLQP